MDIQDLGKLKNNSKLQLLKEFSLLIYAVNSSINYEEKKWYEIQHHFIIFPGFKAVVLIVFVGVVL